MSNEIDYKTLTISQLAYICKRDWKNVYFGAVPFLAALTTLNTVNDHYGMDSGRSIVAYFLSNASSWRGDVARAVKKELTSRLK